MYFGRAGTAGAIASRRKARCTRQQRAILLYAPGTGRAWDWTRAFDRIVISSEVGVRKPSPAIFLRALEAEHLTPDRVLMVGNDERADILGAASAGIAGVYPAYRISPASDPQASAHAALSLAGPGLC